MAFHESGEQCGELAPPALSNELYRRSFSTSNSQRQKLLNDVLDYFNKAFETVQSLPDSADDGIIYNTG